MFDAAIRDRLAVLRNRPFRRLLAGSAVSQFGDGLYAVAAMWLAYSLTNSTAVAGVAGFLTGVPGVLRVFVGPIVDARPLRRVLVGSELAQAAFVLTVPVWFWLVDESVVVVLATMFLAALAGQFAGPAQGATVPRVVDDDGLVRANSLATVVRGATDAGSRLAAGALLAVTSAVAVYLLDVVTFAVAAVVFLGLAIPDSPRSDDEEAATDADAAASDQTESAGSESEGGFDLAEYVADLRAGVGVVAGSVVGSMLVASLLANLLYGVSAAVLPAYADGLGAAAAYGTLLSAMAAGNVVGSIVAPALEDRPLAVTSVLGFAVAGLAWLAGVAAAGLAATAGLFALSRVPLGAYNVGVKSVLQTGVPNDHLGRAMATIGTASAVVTPLGMLAGGALGEVLPARTVLYASGVGLLLAGAYWALVPSLRRFGPPTAVESGAFAVEA